MPAAFLGHGNPMNTLEHNRYTDAWRRFGEACGAPRAVLMVSAHWYTNATALTAMRTPRTIHDFYGFPRELSEFEYPAPGSPELADEIAELVRPDVVGLDEESWGLDHGAWSVLAHAFPNADVPVVQLSINALQPFSYHVELGRRLAPLRESGVVVMGSGNLVHNLRRIAWESPDGGYDWAERMDAAATELMLNRPHDMASLEHHSDYSLSAPTPDHFIPLLYISALAEVADEPASTLVSGLAYGSISMTSFALGMAHAQSHGESQPTSGGACLPDPASAPADQTNL